MIIMSLLEEQEEEKSAPAKLTKPAEPRFLPAHKAAEAFMHMMHSAHLVHKKKLTTEK